MAWRLNKSVLRGEIDSRVKDTVTGRIWLLNRSEPILLSLKGNPHRDMAGCLLTFENPGPDEGDNTKLHPEQNGTVGDMTAARKVRVLDVPVEQIKELKEQGKEVPEHMGNCLYLEWFSDFNGRVVIESTDYDVRISPPAWVMEAEEEKQQAEDNRLAMREWMQHLEEARERRWEEDPYDPDEDKPMDEFEWEKFMKESDARTDKYGALFEKYVDHPDRDRIIAREMGWTWLEEALDADEKGAFKEEREALEEEEIPELVPNPMTEGVDWIRREDGHVVHPLQNRATEIAMSMWHHCDDMGCLKDETCDEDVVEMVSQAQILGAKLAGALNGLAYDEDRDPGFVVACLKRAMGFLNEAIAASERVRAREALEISTLDRFRDDLFSVREEMLVLMETFRKRI